MSILIGIICRDGIVPATDSHITDPYQGTFTSVDKISVVDFVADQVLIAQSGLWPVTNRVVFKIREKAKNIEIKTAQAVTEIIEDSIRESKSKLDADQKEFVRQHGAALMIAFYVDGKPNLLTVDICGSGLVIDASESRLDMQPMNNLRRQQGPGKMGIGRMNMLRFKRWNDVGNPRVGHGGQRYVASEHHSRLSSQ